MSAYNLARWMRDQGNEVGILTTAKSKTEEALDVEVDGFRVWRVWMPRPYPQYHYASASKWLKPIYHLLDHFDPRNRWMVRKIIKKFNPSYINVHFIQGIGYNALHEIGQQKVSTIFFLHDLGLACVRMAMFRDGKECQKQCTLCTLSSKWKAKLVAEVPKIGFCSPSRALLAKLSEFFPIQRYPNTSILNANKYPPATVQRVDSEHVRFIYVGRLHASKGVAQLLAAAAQLAPHHHFTLTVTGNGPDEDALRQAYGDASWCHFTGFVSQAEVSNLMANSDLLCIPSIWLENSPGVVIQALGLGLPVIGSDKGGIPELVRDGVTGRLLPPGDIDAWRDAMKEILVDRKKLDVWRKNCESDRQRFEQDSIGREIIDFQDHLNGHR